MPIGLAVEGANRHDMKLVRATIESIVVDRPEGPEEAPQGRCLDKGYDYDEVRAILDEFGFTAHIKARGEEATICANLRMHSDIMLPGTAENSYR